MRKSLWRANFVFIILTAILFWISCDTDLRNNFDQIFILTYPILFFVQVVYLAGNITLNCMTRESYMLWQGKLRPFWRLLPHRHDPIAVNVIRIIGYLFILLWQFTVGFHMDNAYPLLMGLTNTAVVWIHILSLDAILNPKKQ